MNNAQLKAFIEEVESYLPMIRSLILVCGQEGNYSSELETSLLYAQAIKDTAVITGFADVARFSEQLERELAAVIAARTPVTDAKMRTLLDKIAQIEAVLAKFHLKTDEFKINLDGLLEKSFDNRSNEPSQIEAETDGQTESSSAKDVFEGFEIDEEMLEIFAMEAEDLIRNIQSNLEILSSKPNDRDALLEIRRNAHTLKGSAGIVGLKPLSDLAHRVEDLLDFLSDNEIEGNEKIFDLLMTSTDCLSALSAGEKSPQLSNKISLLYKNFDSVLSLLKLEDEWEKSIEVPQVVVPPTPAPELQPEPAPQVVAQPTAQTAPNGEQVSKTVIRVSLEKLDELVRLVGDLVVSRSVFEQRLNELEKQIKELQHSTERLKRSTGKLETDFEASMLEGNGFGFSQNPNAMAFRNPQLFDSLEFDRYTEFHQTTRELLETTGDTSAINAELDNVKSNLELLFDGQNRLIEDLQDRLLRLRMVRFDSLSARLHRTVRMTCEQEDKQATLFIEGENIEVDTQILDALVEPLLHLLRNAVAHGIESPDTRRLLGKSEKGRIFLRIQSEGTHIILTVTDDGRGISAPAIKEKALQNGFVSPTEVEKMSEEEILALCFLPGLTTAETVRQTAGRGVGMNIIRTNILRQQGTIALSSEPQKGTTITIRLPMALAVTRGLLVKSGGQTFALPLKLVKKLGEISAEELKFAKLSQSTVVDGINYEVAHLNKLLGLPITESRRETAPLLLLDALKNPSALLVEEVFRAEEIVIKPLGTPLRNFPHLLGATILGDGSVVPVLDLIYLLKSQNAASKPSLNLPEDTETETELEAQAEIANPQPQVRVMIVDDSPSVRHIMSKLIKNAEWEAVLAKDGIEALDILHKSDDFPDVILTDVEMPRMNGYELLASLKGEERLQDIPVIMITSRASEKHEQRAFELGVSLYLTKPFDDSFLIEEIKNLTVPVAV